METQTTEAHAIRFQIDPLPGETARGCSFIARSVMSTGRSNLTVLGLYAAVGLLSFIMPPSRLTSFVIGMAGVVGTLYALQALGRASIRRRLAADPHSLETHYVELSPEGVRTWCSHVDARFPWSEFVKARENKEFYALVRPSGTGVSIPKRVIDDATDAALRDRIREWSPDRGAGLAREIA